jgi:hypothetical protein
LDGSSKEASSSALTISCTSEVLSSHTPSTCRLDLHHIICTHSVRFALVVCPIYEDPEDQDSSFFGLHNSSPFPWSWLSTINRVNSQVQKVFIYLFHNAMVSLIVDCRPSSSHMLRFQHVHASRLTSSTRLPVYNTIL